MGARNRDNEHDEFAGFLKELIDHGRLEGPALGITKRVITDGEEGLSDDQRYVFERYVKGDYITTHCKRCSEPIPYSEMFAAWDNGGYCAYCAYMMSKDD